MKDLFKKAHQSKDTKNLKSWAVKLPEETIEEIDRVFEASGLRYKNDFMERMLTEYKLHLSINEPAHEALLHPQETQAAEQDLNELNRLTQSLRSLYLTQTDKRSALQYELDRLKEENALLKQNTGHSVINDYLSTVGKKSLGNQLLVGASGAGKSYAVGLEIKKALANEEKVLLIDAQGEYKPLVDHYKGQHLNLGTHCLNPFEFYTLDDSSYTLREKIAHLLSFIELLLKRSCSSRERAVLLTAIEQMYASFSITDDNENEPTHFPTLQDLEHTLRKMGEKGIELATELYTYTTGSLHGLNGERNIEVVDSPIFHFDIHRVDRMLTEASVFHALDFVYMMLQNGLLDNTLFVFDELWVMQETITLHLFQKILHYGRQRGVRFIMTTQHPTDVYKRFETITGYIDTTVLFKQTQFNIHFLKTYFDLNEREINNLKNAQKGTCLVIPKETFSFGMLYPEDKEISSLLNPLQNKLFM